MLNFLIRLNDGTEFFSRGWVDRPMQELLLTIHAAFVGVRDVEIVGVN